jgi:hypothetical protein
MRFVAKKKCEFFFGRVKNHFKNLPVLGLAGWRRNVVPYVMSGIFLWGIGRAIG